MAFENNQKDFPSPVGDDNAKRKSEFHLPRYFRTIPNSKFLSSTLDQLMQPGVAEKLNGYFGRETAKSFNHEDNYIGDISQNRKDYQFEPAAIIKDDLGNVNFYEDYNDYIAQLVSFNPILKDHSNISTQEYYSWNPHIDWDKFVNFREYYWLSNGPQSVAVRGQTTEVVSTYTVTIADNEDNFGYVFTPDGLTQNPTIKLYRGVTYNFEIDASGLPFTLRTKRTLDDEFLLETEISEQGVESGVVKVIPTESTPNELWYVAGNDIEAAGLIKVAGIEEAAFIDVESEILGKKTYTTGDGFELSNGMKIHFIGDVVPAKFATGEFYVEGVGDKIVLIPEETLTVPSAFVDKVSFEFDNANFDRLPFDEAIGYPVVRDYFLINRASKDGNLWSRYNRWFHKSVIELSASLNDQPVELDQLQRAKRPIIEFQPGLKLFNFGTWTKGNVDLLDTFTTDVFSIIEGSSGYNIDGVDLIDGMRILFLGDPDVLVYGRIFEVKFITFADGSGRTSNRQLSLIDVTDTQPLENEVVLIQNGDTYKGLMYYYNGTKWKHAQTKTKVNQAPLFEIYDENGNSFSNETVYDSSTFTGNKVFSYKEGTGNVDTEVGLALSHRTIENVGDITFNFDLLNDFIEFQIDNKLYFKNTDIGFIRTYSNRETFKVENGWQKALTLSQQPVIRQYVYDNTLNKFEVDVYEDSASLTDLNITVFLNNDLKFKDVDYTLGTSTNNFVEVTFLESITTKKLALGDNIVIKTTSSAVKNDKGFYEIPNNLERNPLNNNLNEFTLGEVNDHVSTIVEGLTTFSGVFPGASNLRDLGFVTSLGKRFVKHSSPLNLAMYHLLNQDANLPQAIRFARKEYAKFKRLFLQVANELGFEGPIKEHVDKILVEINKDKINSMPFYFSDMVPTHGSAKKTTHEIESSTQIYFALSESFTLENSSRRAVQVYKNSKQLIHGKDYTFNSEGFCVVTTSKAKGDLLDIYEYETTNGSYVAPTPTKLGLYPKYEPELFIDTTYQSVVPDGLGPFKIYGYVENTTEAFKRKIGWFYPLYTTEAAASSADLTEYNGAGSAHSLTFEGVFKTFWMPDSFTNYAANDTDDFSLWTEGVPVIQGHDGSKIIAYKDYRDELILELELRIFNNLKVEYDSTLFDIHDFIEGTFRETAYTREESTRPMLSDFIEWLKLIDDDYTDNPFFERTNSFTFNYNSMTSPVDNNLPGFWRGVYNKAYDTDRPHSHPWEMLGFTLKPVWWETVYGVPPYTSDNLILWSDLEKGIVREPNKKIKILKKYLRPGLATFIPVDSAGNLVSPNESGFAKNFNSRTIENPFKFGDETPIETAWRRSSEYPFSLITSWFLSQPCKVLATGFDRERQIKNISKQIVYTGTKNHIKLSELVFPNTHMDAAQTYTSGLINYIAGYMAASVVKSYETYKTNLKNISNQIGFKIGGFTEKDKFKLILDSRTPLNEGNVFIPKENYSIFLNKSTPVKTINYSGVMIEVKENGFKIKGYDDIFPSFKYFKAVPLDNDVVITIGGVSEPFLKFESERFYAAGTIVEFSNKFYRVTKAHTSSTEFNIENFASLPILPTKGGREIIFRTAFNTHIESELDYGAVLPTIQEVVDFLQGYGKYLESQGFIFDNFRGDGSVIDDWKTSCKEFAFWTTHGWAEGTLISLSPGASQLKFKSENAVVENIFDTFFGYTLLKVDGKKLTEEFMIVDRQDPNEFILKPKNTADGIFAIKLQLVQKEHVVLLDNKTVFKDTIYDPEPGYRQERIKVLGYRTVDWDGSLNIPGFIYDESKISDWEPYRDYFIGELVKHKEFFYTANNKIAGKEEFTDKDWNRLDDKPTSQLTPNFEYKTNQFADFYDLDSDNFDTEQQKLAQHLIGYQKRTYLENIINDDVSQYKFYQGYIQDKGTKNALTKLFDVLSSADKDSLQFYEEWAIKRGQYGAAEGFEEVQYILDEANFRLKPQPIDLVETIPETETDLIYRIRPFETYLKPKNYDHKPFPKTYIEPDKGFTNDSGYVNSEDVQFIVETYDSILDINFAECKKGNYIWVGNDKLTWNMYKHADTDLDVESVEGGETEFVVILNSTPKDIVEGELLGVYDLISTTLDPADSSYATVTQSTSAIGAFYKVKDVTVNKITFETTEEIESVESCKGKISKLVSVRTDTLQNLNVLAQKLAESSSLFWLDNDDSNRWVVYENNKAYNKLQDVGSSTGIVDSNYGITLSTNLSNTALVVGAPGEDEGKVYYYRRASSNGNFALRQILEPQEDLATGFKRWFPDVLFVVGEQVKYNSVFYIVNTEHTSTEVFNVAYFDQLVQSDLQKFGASLDLSLDGKYLIVGSPNASNVKTRYKSDYDPSVAYTIGDIVHYNFKLWTAQAQIVPETSFIEFNSFTSTPQLIESIGNITQASEQIPVLLTGNFPFTATTTDHLLIRAPKVMYDGVDANDEVILEWNSFTIANQFQDDYIARQPFAGLMPEISDTFLTNTHVVQRKVDLVLYFAAFTNKPVVGNKVETQAGFGTVVFTHEEDDKLTIYINNVNGSISSTDSLFLESGDFIGEYVIAAPTETIDASNEYGGYWWIDVPTYNVFSSTTDEGKGLVYSDVITDSTVTDKFYYNILDYNNSTLQSSQDTLGSYFKVLSYQGFPGPNGETNPIISSKYVIRAPKDLTDTLNPGDQLRFYMPSLARYNNGFQNDPTLVNLNYTDLNKTLTVDQLWEGYITFDFTKFTIFGDPFEPRIGDTVRDTTTNATADVIFYQRSALEVTIFVNNVNGNWSAGAEFGNVAEIEFLATPNDPDPIYQVNRVMGEIQHKSLGLSSEGIGKLIVIDNGSNIPLSSQNILTDVEYWFYNQNSVQGVPILPNVPSADNNDWKNTYSIPVDANAEASGFTYQGMFSIYETGITNRLKFTNAFTVPEAENYFYLGNDVKLTQWNDFYRGFVKAGGDTKDSTVFPGRIYFIKNGTDSNGNTWAWELGKEKNFQGSHLSSISYNTDDLVYLDGNIFKALSNLDAKIFDGAEWTQITTPLDYLGYIPNNTEILPIFDSADPSTVLDQGSLYSFGSRFDVTNNGEILAVIADYQDAKPKAVVIYRSFNGNYQRHQTIHAPDPNIGFGDDISISKDGTMLAIGVPLDDDVKVSQGKVLVYNQVNGSYVLKQTLNSPNNEKVELFGTRVAWGGDTLAITAKNSDFVGYTTFDINLSTEVPAVPQTIFDNEFTSFAKLYVDTGTVYLYENINNTMVYGQPLSFERVDSTTQNLSVRKFGSNLYSNENHIYVGLPDVSVETNTIGSISDYRKITTDKIWEKHRVPKDTVDVHKIKKLFLYDSKTNDFLTYLDYIDPIQGKIAGIADQELRYKLYYDPAVYNLTGETDLDVVISNVNTWGKYEVGQLWWDLDKARFLNPYQENTIYSVNNWNTLFPGNSIKVYEWVGTKYLPSEWDELSDTEEGITEGVSGKSKYGDGMFVARRQYDPVSETFSNKYYYWVNAKATIPDVEFRTISCIDVENFIVDPAAQGHKFVNFISPSSFVLHNCDGLIKGKDVAFSTEYWTIENQNINIHNQYQLFTEGLETSKPNKDIERKWFDSLVGYDDYGRPVPALNLSPREKYGILNEPRQTWFINREEALKQLIERINGVLLVNLIIDDKDITPLLSREPEPIVSSYVFDTSVSILEELDNVGTVKIKKTKLEPVISNGKIIRVNITEPGRGYLVAPTYTISGDGIDAKFQLTINSVGSVTEVAVINEGQNYTSKTIIEVRQFTVLVKSDSSLQGKWALYQRDTANKDWERIQSQAFDVSLFWDYVDWYDTGYNEFTTIDYLIDASHQLQGLDDVTGDIVKIANIGSGGWLLLEKIDDADFIDYTINYKTVGRESGTLKFLSSLYDSATTIGYDSVSYDTKFYDNQPVSETRKILETLRDKIFIDELAVEYNNMFLSSIRYVFSEQSYVDWAFKTSFIKAKHNVGNLEERVTFQNDNLASYEEYLKEVKPYKTKLREYVSDYDGLEPSKNLITDFDLSPYYNAVVKAIVPQTAKVIDNIIVGKTPELSTYPNKNWLDNLTYQVTSVKIADGGKNYTFPPQLVFSDGDSTIADVGSGAKAIATLGVNGEIVSVKVTKPGTGYLSAPVIEVNGDGTGARLVAVVGDGLVRSMHTVVKFDRVTGVFVITNLNETETFAGTGSTYIFNLVYPLDMRTNTIEVLINDALALKSEYTYKNILDTTKGYDRYYGRIEFVIPPISGREIKISYKKPIELLQAQDRISLFYEPTTGQFGKDLAQLMDGIDYGGVEVKSFEFGGTSGWDSNPWYSDSWDTYDTTFEDEIFVLDGSTISVELSKPLETSVVYNLYRNGIRLDDPQWTIDPDSTLVENPNAIMRSITGDGTTQTLELQELEIPTQADDVIILRKTTSDGSFVSDPESFDTALSGGNLLYTTATGLNAEDISVDGDGFITPTSSKGPEEVIPGQVLDAVDITVFERPTTGSSIIINKNYVGDGVTTVYDTGKTPFTDSALFVKINSDIIPSSLSSDSSYEIEFTVDYKNSTVIFNIPPADGARVNLTLVEPSGLQILDMDSFVSDGSSNTFETNVRWSENIDFIASSNGVKLESVIVKSQGSHPNNVELVLAQPLREGDVVRYALFSGTIADEEVFSQVVIDEFISDGSTTTYDLSQTPFGQEPSAFYTLVQVKDKILNAGYNQTFTMTTSKEYQLDLWQAPVGTLQNHNIEVYLNKIKLSYPDQWTFVGADSFDATLPVDQQRGSAIVLDDSVGEVGDTLGVFIISEGEYRFGYHETDADSAQSFISTPGVLHLDSPYDINDIIKVYQFSNNEYQNFDRQKFEIKEKTKLTEGSDDYYFLNNLRAGLIELRTPAVDAKYVWVILNGTLLMPNVDYRVTENQRYVRLLEEPKESDVVETLHFGNPTVITKHGWRQFKDMLNRNHYKRIDGSKNYLLLKDLNWYDKTIEVTADDDLTIPASGSPYPGVIWVNGERIEYFIREGNALKQLRRGTLGTGVKEVHSSGTEVYEQSSNSSMPYKDETITTIFAGDGTTSIFELDFAPQSIDEFEVFVAGKRLRKNAISSYNFETLVAQDSPEGDVTLAAEFSLQGSALTLLNAPAENQKIIVIRRQGKIWSEQGTPLSQADTDIGRFLRATSVDLPR